MKTTIWRILAAIFVLAAPPVWAQTQVVVKTASGLVAGSGTEVHVWKGIPYARPPVGDLRWKAPQPPAPWPGIRHAFEFGPMCPQGSAAHLKPDMSEDCLNLNVWSGAKTGDRRPVLVWIHGGGFRGGSNRIDGEPLARLGVVVVSINYRLGILGFMAHPDLTREAPYHSSGNYGMLDQIAALHWVHDNIAAFGGDPDRVTIGGASAGGTSVGYLLASPMAAGLFQGAWLDSASRLFLPDPELTRTYRGLTPMEEVGLKIAPHVKELRALSASAVMIRGEEVTDALYGEGGGGKIGLKPESRVHAPFSHDHPWWAFTDGFVMPRPLAEMFASGRFHHVAVLIGTCKDEGMSFTGKMPDMTEAAYHTYLRKYYPNISSDMFAMYPGKTPAEIRAAVTRTITDAMFLYGSIRVADDEAAAGKQVYVERFARVPPGAPGTLHGSDNGYFRGEVKAGEGRWNADDVRLAARMVQRMAAFVKTSDPNSGGAQPEWPTWTVKNRQYLEIGDQIQPRPFQNEDIMDLYRKQFGP